MASIEGLGNGLSMTREANKEPAHNAWHCSAVYHVRDCRSNLKVLFRQTRLVRTATGFARHPAYGVLPGENPVSDPRCAGGPGSLSAHTSGGPSSIAPRESGPSACSSSLYDEILLFHCSSKEASTKCFPFLNEEFRDFLEFVMKMSIMADQMDAQLPRFAVRPAADRDLGMPEVPWHGPDPGKVMVTGIRNESRRELVDCSRIITIDTFAGSLDEPHLLPGAAANEGSQSFGGSPTEKLIELIEVPFYEIDQRNRQFELALSIDPILRELGWRSCWLGDGWAAVAAQ